MGQKALQFLLEKIFRTADYRYINQGGASGSIGSQFVKEQPSDGYTLLVCAETMGNLQNHEYLRPRIR